MDIRVFCSEKHHLCAKRQYPKMTRDSREVAEAIVMISRMKESYLAWAAKASRPAQAQCRGTSACPDVAVRMIDMTLQCFYVCKMGMHAAETWML